MRVRYLLAFFVCLGLAPALLADSQSWRFVDNNNRIIDAQSGGDDSATAGSVKLTFYGHMAFKITSPAGLEILVDPWRNDPSGAWGLWFHTPFPEIPVDAVLSTHAHFDHDAVYRPRAVMVLERLAGELRLGDVKISGLADKHVCEAPGWYKWHLAAAESAQDFCAPSNPLHMDNFIQVIETGGVRIAHWGDNRPRPAPFVDAALQGVDVLILPIDESSHLLSEAEVAQAIERYRPKIVIPAHYRMAGVTSVLTTLGTADSWVNKQADVVRLEQPVLELSPDRIADFSARVYYFGATYASE